MFARNFISALVLLAVTSCTIPIQKTPRQIERPPALIETAGPEFAAACQGQDGWDTPAPPVRIHGNSYLVGTCGISAILITGGAGHILIDSGTEAGAEVIARNIQSLGFKLADVKLLLHSHEHIDHVGGMARLQRLTGASLVASPDAAAVFGKGTPGADDPQVGMHPPFPIARVDRVIRDGEQVRLGNIVVTALTTAGHTPGALTWHWGSCDGGVCRQLVFADSLSPVSRDDYRFSARPAYLAAYRQSLARVAALDCDILLTPHPSASNMADRLGGKAPLTDANGCRAYAATIAKRLDDRIAKESAK